MIQIAPWEKSLIRDIEKAILASDIGITPNNDGSVIRLVFPELTEERRKELEKIHSAAERLENGEELLCNDGSKYTEEQNKKDLAIVYTQSAIKVAKLYAPSVILGALSITAILSSNNILRKRNVALAAAYTAVDKSFKEYRGRIVGRLRGILRRLSSRLGRTWKHRFATVRLSTNE